MKVLYALAVTIAIMTASGCSTRNAYEGLRFHQEMDCQKLQDADRDACLRRSGMSYDEYQRQLKERNQAR